MITLLSSIALFILFILIWKYFSSKNKSQNQKSSIESIASTIGNSVNRNLKNYANDIRTLEQIKKELLHEIDTAKKDLRNNFKTYLINVISTKETHLNIIDQAKINIEKALIKAKDFKSKYDESQDLKDKQFAEKYLSQVIMLEKQIETSKSIVDKNAEYEIDAQINFDISMYNLSNKHSEIVSMICSPDNSFAFANINISDLVVEFKEKMSEKEIEIKTNNIINKLDNSEIGNNVSSVEIKSRFDNL